MYCHGLKGSLGKSSRWDNRALQGSLGWVGRTQTRLGPGPFRSHSATLKAALLLQLFVVGTFMLLAGVFYRRTIEAGIRNPKLTAALVTLYCSTVLLTCGPSTVLSGTGAWHSCTSARDSTP
jgi:hypothetical protein